MRHAILWILLACLAGCSDAKESAPNEHDAGAADAGEADAAAPDTKEVAADAGAEDSGPAPCEGETDGPRCAPLAHCDGPFTTGPSFDSCDAVHPKWDTRSDVPTIEACFELCAAHPGCRAVGSVQYNPEKQSCILNASCSPEPLGYFEYVASGGCSAPKQCWAWEKVSDPKECGGVPSGYSYFETKSIEECIAKCEENPRKCGSKDRVDFDPSTGNCMTERPYGCLITALGYEEIAYHEVPCE